MPNDMEKGKIEEVAMEAPIESVEPAMNLINDYFVRRSRINLSNHFAGPIDVFVESTKIQTFGEVLKQTIVPSMLCLTTMKPLEGYALLSFQPSLVFTMVDLTFGGTGELKVRAEGRDFTPIERKTMNEVISLILKDIKVAWGPFSHLNPEIHGYETKPQLLKGISRAEQVVRITFGITAGGEIIEPAPDYFDLCLPVQMLDPIRDRLRQGTEVFTIRNAKQTVVQPIDDQVEPIELIKSLDGETLANLIGGEHPQTITYVLSLLEDTKKAGDVLSSLPHNLRADVSYRIAILKKTRKKIKQGILDMLADEARHISIDEFEQLGGREVCYDILQNAGEELLEDVLSTIRIYNPDLADQLLDAGKIYSMMSTEISKSLQTEQTIDTELAKDLVRSRQKMQAMQKVFDDVFRLLSEGGKELVNALENIDQSMEDSFSSLSEERLENLYRETLVDAMILSVDYWLQTSGKDKIELAEESNIWTASLDKGSYQTRTLDKYLGLSKLPQNPRWKDVVQTVQFVLEAGPESHPLKPKLQSSISQLHALMRSKNKLSDSISQ